MGGGNNGNHPEVLATIQEAQNGTYAEVERLACVNRVLESAAHRFEELFQGIPVACYTYDEKGRIHEWNRAAESLFEYPAVEVFEKVMWDILFFREDRGKTRDIVSQVFSGASFEGLNWRYRRRSGAASRVLCNTFPLRHLNGAITGGICANVDITERLLAEEARQAEQQRKVAVADAVGDIAHDLKNMMSPVEGWADALEGMAPECYQALDRLCDTPHFRQSPDLSLLRDFFALLPDAVEGIRSGAEDAKDRGAEIADALKGNLRAPRFVVRQIANTANRVVKTLKNKADAAGIDLGLEGVCRPFPYDQAHLFNAIYNLVYNAIPYTSGGRITVRLSEQNGCAVIQVVDTGQGMPENVLKALFTDHTISTTPGGTGLGTRIVARVAAIHGGSVTASSAPGRGTRITLSLPLHRD